MFEKSKEFLSEKLNKINKLAFVVNIALQILYIAYLGYSLYAKKGIVICNIILLLVSFVYLIVFIISEYQEGKKQKKLEKTNKAFKKWSKRFVKLYTLAVGLYSLYYSAIDFGLANFNYWSFIYTIFMLILWFFQLYLDLVMFVVKRQLNKIKVGISNVSSNIKKKFVKN